MTEVSTPEPFTADQRALFRKVAGLNRNDPEAFAEADRWIDGTNPRTAREQLGAVRKTILREAKRRRSDPAYGLAPDVVSAWVQFTTALEAQSADSSPLPWYFTLAQLATILDDGRRRRAASIRTTRQTLRAADRRERKAGPRSAYDRMEYVVQRLLVLDFDRMEPGRKTLWARRVLRVAWVLTHTAALTGTRFSWLKSWPWGEYVPGGDADDVACDIVLSDTHSPGTPVQLTRQYARLMLLDRHREKWARLVADALHVVGLNTDSEAEGDEALDDGLHAPDRFCWKGKSVTMPATPWRLLRYLWVKLSAGEDAVLDAVWGDNGQTCFGLPRIKSAMRRVNHALLEVGCPRQLRRKNGHVLLD